MLTVPKMNSRLFFKECGTIEYYESEAPQYCYQGLENAYLYIINNSPHLGVYYALSIGYNNLIDVSKLPIIPYRLENFPDFQIRDNTNRSFLPSRAIKTRPNTTEHLKLASKIVKNQ